MGGVAVGDWSAATDQGPLARERSSPKSSSNSLSHVPVPTGLHLSLDLGRYSRSRLRAEARPRRERKRRTGYLAHPAAPCVHSAWPGVLSAGGTAWSRRAGGRARPAPSGSRNWNERLGSRWARGHVTAVSREARNRPPFETWGGR